MKNDVARSLVRSETGNDDFRAVYRFDPDLQVFRGHFPNAPMVPGVFQIEMARQAAEALVGRALRVREVRKAKFTAVVAPGDVVLLEGRLSRNGTLVAASVTARVGEAVVGQVTLVLEELPS